MTRAVLVGIGALLLAAGGLLYALDGPRDGQEATQAPQSVQGAAERGGGDNDDDRAAGVGRPAGDRRRGSAGRAGVAGARELGSLGRDARRAKQAAKRFWWAFAAYELGELGPALRTRLRATATSRFAEELLARPPRVPEGAERPPAARLSGVRFDGGALDSRRPRYLDGVATLRLRRGGAGSRIALRLRSTARGWRVAGVGE